MSSPLEIRVPQVSLVVLVGCSGSGKSTFARAHFGKTEILSSDFFRGLVGNDENDQSVSGDAFAALHDVLGRRLRRGLLTVVDATNVEEAGRRQLLAVAREADVMSVAIVLDLGVALSHARNQDRPDRQFGRHVVARQHAELRKSLRQLEREGFHRVFVLKGEDDVARATIVRERLWNDLRHETGPFDVIGDVHGCRAELEILLDRLGYVGEARAHPAGRRAVFLGDLVDRGPDVPGVLRVVMQMADAGHAFCVVGNHEAKLVKALRTSDRSKMKIGAGLQVSLDQLEAIAPGERDAMTSFMDGLVGHYVLDGGRLVVAHAGLKEAYQGRASRRVREFALYGETTGEIDAYGLPVRADWAEQYRGKAVVVYGHTPVPEARWVNGTICVDTGCVFGGKLTALRWPERELVSVPAAQVWFEPVRPLALEAPFGASSRDEGALLLGDAAGKRFVETKRLGNVTVREEQAQVALEAMSRFGVDPRWLIYLPATMSPAASAPGTGVLERPDEAFAYFLEAGADRVVCETKHMGSRAIVVCCKDAGVAARRFGDGSREGVVYTRTGRPFFADDALEQELLGAVRAAMDAAELWRALRTDWIALDCELLPWSAKAMSLVREQYAAVGAAGEALLSEALEVTARAAGPDAEALRRSVAARLEHLRAFRAAYRPFVREVTTAADLSLAPFAVLATDHEVWDGRDRGEHHAVLSQLVHPRITRTEHHVVALGDAASEASASAWWRALTDAGGEGIVVKPFTPLPLRAATIDGRPAPSVQPALKVRGPGYLRLIYGAEHATAERIEQLGHRQLGGKRRLAAREHALGYEALDRFVQREPLHRVHECVFAVLALESDPIDPRL